MSAPLLRERFGIDVRVGPEVSRVSHILSHRRIEGSIRACAWQMGSLGRGKDGMMRWVRIGQVTRYPIPAHCRKILAVVAPP